MGWTFWINVVDQCRCGANKNDFEKHGGKERGVRTVQLRDEWLIFLQYNPSDALTLFSHASPRSLLPAPFRRWWRRPALAVAAVALPRLLPVELPLRLPRRSPRRRRTWPLSPTFSVTMVATTIKRCSRMLMHLFVSS